MRDTMNDNHAFDGSERVSKRLLLVVAGAAALLLVPWVAMQCRADMRWDLFDVVFMGVLLLGLLFLLAWAELGVGMFGTPFAGN